MTEPAKEFKISKKFMSDFAIKPITPNCQEYIIHIGNHGSTQHPFMYLHEGSSTKEAKTIVGSVRRYPEDGDEGDGAFEITSNGFGDVEDVTAVTMLRRPNLRNADLEFGSGDKPRELAWRPNVGPGQSSKLMDMMGPDTVLAVYDENPVLGRGGKLTLNVDWGLDFERAVILSMVNMIEKLSVWGKLFHSRGRDVPIGQSRFAGQMSYPGFAIGLGIGGVGGGGGGGGCDGGGGGGGC